MFINITLLLIVILLAFLVFLLLLTVFFAILNLPDILRLRVAVLY